MAKIFDHANNYVFNFMHTLYVHTGGLPHAAVLAAINILWWSINFHTAGLVNGWWMTFRAFEAIFSDRYILANIKPVEGSRWGGRWINLHTEILEELWPPGVATRYLLRWGDIHGALASVAGDGLPSVLFWGAILLTMTSQGWLDALTKPDRQCTFDIRGTVHG